MNKKEKQTPGAIPEVDDLLADDPFAGNRFEEHWSDDGGQTPAPSRRQKRTRAAGAKKKKFPVVPVVLAAVLVLLLAGAVLVAEPWVPSEKSTLTEAPTTELAPVTLAVGDSYKVEVPLGDNEVIDSVTADNPDVLQVDGTTVTAEGEYFRSNLTITVREVELPSARPAHTVKLLGRDISAPVEKVRRFLRNLLGVEKAADIRTELRTTAIYTQPVGVAGLNKVTDKPDKAVETYLQNSVVLELAVDKGQTVQLSAPGSAVSASVLAEKDGYVYIQLKGLEAAQSTVTVSVGAEKTISAEDYADYLKVAVPAAGLPENTVFVTHRVVVYTVSVIDLAATTVTTDPNAQNVESVYKLDPGFNADITKELFALVNALRKQNSLPELTWNDAYTLAAETRAKELSGLFGHTRPDGTAGLALASGAKYELIGCGSATAAGVFAAWNSDSALRAEMLDPAATAFGATFYRVEDGSYCNYQCGYIG